MKASLPNYFNRLILSINEKDQFFSSFFLIMPDDPESPIQTYFESAQFFQSDPYQSIIRVGIAINHSEITCVGSPWVSQYQTG